MTCVTLSLVSHTNVGKTTLARTLLRRDVGEVLDHAHVTEVGEAHELIRAGDHVLMLWDTPGFGDSARLARRLRKQDGGLGAFLADAWDRIRDRPLWCSQQAIRNIREDADVVLYLVNASEHPEDAGYLTHELDILEWIGRPVMVLLNQTGPDGEEPRSVAAWKEHLAPWSCVRELLTLDAFSRSPLHEAELLDHVSEHLDGEQKSAMTWLARSWRDRSEAVFAESIGALVEHVMRATRDRESLPRRLASKTEKAAAMEALAARHLRSKRELGELLIDRHQLDGRPAADLKEQLADFEFEGDQEWSWKRSAILGSAVSGALTGLAADILSGGLSFGGGLVAGGLAGALGGVGLAQGVQYFGMQGEPAVGWANDFLESAVREGLATYLTIAHFGRGRGRFEGRESPLVWSRATDRSWRDSEARGQLDWKAGRGDEEAKQREFTRRLRGTISLIAKELMRNGPRDQNSLPSSQSEASQRTKS